MSEEPSNAVLLEKIEGHAKMSALQFEQINEHLKRLNGQVIKNTKFRWQALVYGSIAMIVVPLIVARVVGKII